MLKRIPAAALSLLLLMPLTSCSATGGKPTAAGNGAAGVTGSGSGTTLTIAATFESQMLELAVTDFEKANPGVHVQVQNFNQQLQGMKGSGQATDTATIIQQLNAEN